MEENPAAISCSLPLRINKITEHLTQWQAMEINLMFMQNIEKKQVLARGENNLMFASEFDLISEKNAGLCTLGM